MGNYPLEKVFKMLNVLNNRLSVSRDELASECELSERSVYRYVNRLSEAGIPIYYDKNTGRYKLLRTLQFDVNRLSTSDAIVMRLALHLLINRLDDDYPHATHTVRSLLDRISSPQSHESASFQSAGYAQLDTEGASITEILNCAVLFEASLSRKKVRVYFREINGTADSIIIQKPALKCSDKWEVIDQIKSLAQPIPVESIKEVRIL